MYFYEHTLFPLFCCEFARPYQFKMRSFCLQKLVLQQSPQHQRNSRRVKITVYTLSFYFSRGPCYMQICIILQQNLLFKTKLLLSLHTFDCKKNQITSISRKKVRIMTTLYSIHSYTLNHPNTAMTTCYLGIYMRLFWPTH